MLSQMARSISFSRVDNIPMCCAHVLTQTHFFIHSSSDECPGCFNDLAIVNNAAVHREVHIAF